MILGMQERLVRTPTSNRDGLESNDDVVRMRTLDVMLVVELIILMMVTIVGL